MYDNVNVYGSFPIARGALGVSEFVRSNEAHSPRAIVQIIRWSNSRHQAETVARPGLWSPAIAGAFSRCELIYRKSSDVAR
jgi:hypothetical protein